MWTILRDNRGSITVEMCFVMPIAVGIIMLLIMTILKGVNEGAALGESQVLVYEYSELREQDGLDASWGSVQSILNQEDVKGRVQVNDDQISVTISSEKQGEINSVTNIGCKREWNLCTHRLRRWQLYGDVLCE